MQNKYPTVFIDSTLHPIRNEAKYNLFGEITTAYFDGDLVIFKIATRPSRYEFHYKDYLPVCEDLPIPI